MDLYKEKDIKTCRFVFRREKNTSFIFQTTRRVRFETSIILFINIIFLMLMLVLQNILGIGPGMAHIDESTYLTPGTNACQDITTIYQVIGRSYFCFVKLLNFNVVSILVIQCALYLLTSYIIYSRIKDICTTPYSYFLLIFLVFDPYRAHLALHVLKETFIIAGVVLLQRNLTMGILLATAFRFYSFIYLLIFIRPRNVVVMYLFFFIIVLVFQPSIISHIIAGGNADMQFREFDRVPTFNDFGIAGDLLRAILWPFLLISGTFIFISPDILFLPIAMGVFFASLFVLKMKLPVSSLFGSFVVLATLALIAPGFTSFTRYAYPVIIAVPMLALGVNRFICHTNENS